MLTPLPSFKTSGRITKNFRLSEFACHGRDCCGGAAPINFELVERLQKLRDNVGRPLHINSGFRCPVHNKAVGGASKSMHMLGLAADIATPYRWSAAWLAAEADIVGFGKIIIYSWGIHVDIRTW